MQDPRPEDMERLNHAADLIGADRRILVAQVKRSIEGKRHICCNLPWLLRYLSEA